MKTKPPKRVNIIKLDNVIISLTNLVACWIFSKSEEPMKLGKGHKISTNVTYIKL